MSPGSPAVPTGRARARRRRARGSRSPSAALWRPGAGSAARRLERDHLRARRRPPGGGAVAGAGAAVLDRDRPALDPNAVRNNVTSATREQHEPPQSPLRSRRARSRLLPSPPPHHKRVPGGAWHPRHANERRRSPTDLRRARTASDPSTSKSQSQGGGRRCATREVRSVSHGRVRRGREDSDPALDSARGPPDPSAVAVGGCGRGPSRGLLFLVAGLIALLLLTRSCEP